MKKLAALLLLACIIFASSTAMAKRSNEKKSKGKGGPEARSAAREEVEKEKPREVKNKAQKAKTENLRKKKSERVRKASNASPHAKQLEIFKKQLAHEQEKHFDRIAKLQRISDLDKKQGDGKFTAKIAELTKKEQIRYARKTAMVKMRIRMAENAAAKRQPSEDRRSKKEKVDKADDKDNGDDDKDDDGGKDDGNKND